MISIAIQGNSKFANETRKVVKAVSGEAVKGNHFCIKGDFDSVCVALQSFFMQAVLSGDVSKYVVVDGDKQTDRWGSSSGECVEVLDLDTGVEKFYFIQ